MSDMPPEGWFVVRLEGLVDILDSLRVPINSDERQARAGSVPYYGATGRVGWIDDFIFDEELVLLGEDGAPFFDKSKPIAYLVSGKTWVNNHAHVLRAHDGLTNNRFIKYFLDAFDFTDSVNGTTRLKLTQGAMRAIPVALPPLAEQRRIVAKVEGLLARVNTVRERMTKAPTILNRFRQSVLAAACSGQLTADWREDDGTLDEACLPTGWTASVVGDHFSIDSGEAFKKVDYSSTGLRLFQIANVGFARTIWDQRNFLPISFRRSHAKLMLEPGQIVLALNRPILGDQLKVAMISECDLPAILYQRVGRLIRKSKIRVAYAFYYFQSRSFFDYVSERLQGTDQPYLNTSLVPDIPIPVPPLEEQEVIVQRVNDLFTLADKIESRVQAASARVEKISQSILAKAFRGELVPIEAELARQEGRDYEPASALLERIRKDRAAVEPTPATTKRRKAPAADGEVKPPKKAKNPARSSK